MAEDSVDMIGRLLHFASEGNVAAVKEMLDENVDLKNAKDYDGRTAMHLAACDGHYHVVELLLSYGADVRPLDRWNDTPLASAKKYRAEGDITRRSDYTKVCQLLKKHDGQCAEDTEEDEHLIYEIGPTELDMTNARTIGMGSYGEVLLVKWRGTQVAAKRILQRGKLAKKEEIEKEFLLELSVLQRLRHPNIVEFLGAITANPLVIVTEYLPNGDLHEIIQRKGRLPAKEAVSYALDIARGMNYLHRHKPEAIIHRDLKPRNLLQDEAGHLKVADFGLSKLLDSKAGTAAANGEMTGETGTYRYMAPEVFLHQAYDLSADVFSFAIIVQEMFEGGPVLQSTGAHDVARDRAYRNKRPVFFAKTYPPLMKELLRQCWDKDPTARPSFADIIGRLEIMLDDLKLSSRSWKHAHKPLIHNLTTTWHKLTQQSTPFQIVSRVLEKGQTSQLDEVSKGSGTHHRQLPRCAMQWQRGTG